MGAANYIQAYKTNPVTLNTANTDRSGATTTNLVQGQAGDAAGLTRALKTVIQAVGPTTEGEIQAFIYDGTNYTPIPGAIIPVAARTNVTLPLQPFSAVFDWEKMFPGTAAGVPLMDTSHKIAYRTQNTASGSTDLFKLTEFAAKG